MRICKLSKPGLFKWRPCMSVLLAALLTAVSVNVEFSTGQDSASGERPSARDGRGAELDRKITKTRILWRRLRRSARAAGEQARDNLAADAAETRGELNQLLEQRRALYRTELEGVKRDLSQAWVDLSAAGADAQTDITRELDGLRGDWQALYRRLSDSFDQSVEQLRDELAQLEKEAIAAADDLTVEVAAIASFSSCASSSRSCSTLWSKLSLRRR